MPRIEPIPEREAAICKRVREFRESTKLSRVAFAAHVGVDSSELIRIEHLRVALRYAVGDKIARRFHLCQRWLAEGKEPKQHYVEIHPEALPVLPAKMPFSAAYDLHLKRAVDSRVRLQKAGEQGGMVVDFPFPVGTPDRAIYAHYIEEIIRADLVRLPPELYKSYHDVVLGAGKDFLTRHNAQIEAYLRPQRAQGKRKPKS